MVSPSPGGFWGAASPDRWTQIPEGVSHRALKQQLEGFSSILHNFCNFWEPQKCWNVTKLELQGERGQLRESKSINERFSRRHCHHQRSRFSSSILF